MSLREIRSHTSAEVRLMLRALSRFNVIRDGRGVTHDMVKAHPELIELRDAYEQEAYKMRDYREKLGLDDEEF